MQGLQPNFTDRSCQASAADDGDYFKVSPNNKIVSQKNTKISPPKYQASTVTDDKANSIKQNHSKQDYMATGRTSAQKPALHNLAVSQRKDIPPESSPASKKVLAAADNGIKTNTNAQLVETAAVLPKKLQGDQSQPEQGQGVNSKDPNALDKGDTALEKGVKSAVWSKSMAKGPFTARVVPENNAKGKLENKEAPSFLHAAPKLKQKAELGVSSSGAKIPDAGDVNAKRRRTTKAAKGDILFRLYNKHCL